MWSLGATLTLPLLNQNQGPIAEAEAKRAQAAAHFLTVQSDAISEIDGALAGYQAALQQVATAKSLLDDSQKRLDSIRVQEKAGELDPGNCGRRGSGSYHQRAKPLERIATGATGARQTRGRRSKSVDLAEGSIGGGRAARSAGERRQKILAKG